MQLTPHTVEFDVVLDGGTKVGSMITWALPARGDLVRVDEPGKQPVYEVLRCYFEPDNITVIVHPAGEPTPSGESSASAFARQVPGAGGFAS